LSVISCQLSVISGLRVDEAGFDCAGLFLQEAHIASFFTPLQIFSDLLGLCPGSA
jgi:hypothetical protein